MKVYVAIVVLLVAAVASAAPTAKAGNHAVNPHTAEHRKANGLAGAPNPNKYQVPATTFSNKKAAVLHKTVAGSPHNKVAAPHKKAAVVHHMATNKMVAAKQRAAKAAAATKKSAWGAATKKSGLLVAKKGKARFDPQCIPQVRREGVFIAAHIYTNLPPTQVTFPCGGEDDQDFSRDSFCIAHCEPARCTVTCQNASDLVYCEQLIDAWVHLFTAAELVAAEMAPNCPLLECPRAEVRTELLNETCATELQVVRERG